MFVRCTFDLSSFVPRLKPIQIVLELRAFRLKSRDYETFIRDEYRHVVMTFAAWRHDRLH